MPPRKRKPLAAQDPNAKAPADADAGRAKAVQILPDIDEQGELRCGLQQSHALSCRELDCVLFKPV